MGQSHPAEASLGCRPAGSSGARASLTCPPFRFQVAGHV
jgi:hypothetical protein